MVMGSPPALALADVRAAVSIVVGQQREAAALLLAPPLRTRRPVRAAHPGRAREAAGAGGQGHAPRHRTHHHHHQHGRRGRETIAWVAVNKSTLPASLRTDGRLNERMDERTYVCMSAYCLRHDEWCSSSREANQEEQTKSPLCVGAQQGQGRPTTSMVVPLARLPCLAPSLPAPSLRGVASAAAATYIGGRQAAPPRPLLPPLRSLTHAPTRTGPRWSLSLMCYMLFLLLLLHRLVVAPTTAAAGYCCCLGAHGCVFVA